MSEKISLDSSELIIIFALKNPLGRLLNRPAWLNTLNISVILKCHTFTENRISIKQRILRTVKAVRFRLKYSDLAGCANTPFFICTYLIPFQVLRGLLLETVPKPNLKPGNSFRYILPCPSTVKPSCTEYFYNDYRIQSCNLTNCAYL